MTQNKSKNSSIDFSKKNKTEEYRNAMLRHPKEHWGEDFGEEKYGYIDSIIEVVVDEQLAFPFKGLKREQLSSYISGKLVFPPYARLWNSTQSEYEIDVPTNIGTTSSDVLSRS
ncbi:hypothetical protein [Acidovorax sp. 1608163]|uniref:hypothetical protein n=1 Tax=Acidovorax sp. 1608163 TaxID=2478662 RepID=UPI0013CEBDA7|nr:hypothetical protein [Acidovorax sp. 1608163]